MAQEHLTSFEPEDICRVVLQCTKCRGELSFPVGTKQPMLNILNKCPVCFEEWDRNRERFGVHKAQLDQLVGALGYFSNKLTLYHPRDGHSWKVRLVIEDEPHVSE